jgi:hypothetical protein
MPQTIEIPFGGQEIGQGHNSQTRESIGTALTVANISEDKQADGQIVTTRFISVTTQQSLMESIGASVAIDSRYGLLSGDARVSFSESNSVNSFSSYIAGRCVVANAIRTGHDFRLNDKAQPLVKAREWVSLNSAMPLACTLHNRFYSSQTRSKRVRY